MKTDKINRIIEKNQNDIAFIIGNGINNYKKRAGALSWESLLINLWMQVTGSSMVKRPQGISLTEFYDVLDIENSHRLNLQQLVASNMNGWSPMKHHIEIVNKIHALNAPILTTNFEETLSKHANYRLYSMGNTGFTDFYPWSSFYSDRPLDSPTTGFGIWHINGMIKYPRSIRLGLGHYMGCVTRARPMIHKNSGDSLFSGKNIHDWKGSKTWLHIIFNKHLFVFGLGLEENEVFLRWLLLERMKYFKMFPERTKHAWYVDLGANIKTNPGKEFFLKEVGFNVINISTYEELYENFLK